MNDERFRKYAIPFYWLSAAAFCILMIQAAAQNYIKVIIQTACFILAIGIILIYNRKKLDIRYCRIRDKQDAAYYVFAVVFLAIAVPFSHKVWKTQAFRLAFLKQHNISPDFVLSLLPYVLAICAFPAVVSGIKYILRDCLDIKKNVWEDNKYLGKSVAILSGVYCFAIIAIIRADYIYKDDMQRLAWGSTVYGRESRFVGEFITFFLHFDEFFADTSPLPQICEMIIMAAFAVIVYSVISDRKKPGFYGILAMVPFALSPYFLECVSFKYDSPQHALAALFSVLPLLYWNKDRKKFLLATVICMLLMCMSHQVLMMFYPSMVALLCILAILNGEYTIKDALIKAGQSAIVFVIGMAIYRFGILRVLPSGTNFTSTEMLSAKDFVPGVIRNYTRFFTTILEQFNLVWIGLIIILCISFVIILVQTALIKKKQAIFLSVACLIILLAFSFSMYPVLEEPLYSPRHMYSFGLFVGLITTTIAAKLNPKNVIPKASIILLATAFVVFTFVYGNALQQQKDYTSYRVEMVLDDLTEITSENPNTTYSVQVEGTTGYSPSIDAMPESLEMVRVLVTASFSEYFHNWWASGICEYYGLNIRCRNIAEEEDFRELNLPLVEKNYYHTIYADDEHILVVLEDR